MEYKPATQLATITTMDVDIADDTPQLETTVKEFIPSRVVYDTGGKSYLVPSTAKANRHCSQMIVSKIRFLLNKKIDQLTELNVPIEVRVLKDLTTTASVLHAMSMDAYGGGKIPVKEEQMSAFEKMATDVVEAAAKGTASALSSEFEKKLQRIQSLGRATKPVEPINVKTNEPRAASTDT